MLHGRDVGSRFWKKCPKVLSSNLRQTGCQSLDGKTPREAARTTTDRKKVVDWLKLIENRSSTQAGSPLTEYDFRWMCEELELEDRRR
jgi:hypothetical protein